MFDAVSVRSMASSKMSGASQLSKAKSGASLRKAGDEILSQVSHSIKSTFSID